MKPQDAFNRICRGVKHGEFTFPEAIDKAKSITGSERLTGHTSEQYELILIGLSIPPDEANGRERYES